MSSKTVRQKLLATVAASLLLSSAGYIDDALASRGRKTVETDDSDKSKKSDGRRKTVQGTPNSKNPLSRLQQEQAAPSSPSKGGSGTAIWMDKTQRPLTSKQIEDNISSRPYAFTMAEFIGTFIPALTKSGAEETDARYVRKSISSHYTMALVLSDEAKDKHLTKALDATLGVFYARVIKLNPKALDTVLSNFEGHDTSHPVAIDEVDNNPFNITVNINADAPVSLLEMPGEAPYPCNRIYHGFHETSDEILYSYSTSKIKALKAEQEEAERLEQEEATRLEQEQARLEQARLEKEEEAATLRAQQEKEAQEEEIRINAAADRLLNDSYPNLKNLDFIDGIQDSLRSYLVNGAIDSDDAFFKVLRKLKDLKASRSKVQRDQFMDDALHPQFFFEAASRAIAHFKSNPKDTNMVVEGYTFGLEHNKLVVIDSIGEATRASIHYNNLEESHYRQGRQMIQSYNDEIARIKSYGGFSRFLTVLKLIKSNTGESKLLKAAIKQNATQPTAHILEAVKQEAISMQ